MEHGPTYLQPARPRRGADLPVPTRSWGGRRPGGVVKMTVADAVQAMLTHHGLDWARTTAKATRTSLLGGRFRDFLEDRGIRTIDALTTDACAEFLTLQSGLVKPSTIAKYRTTFLALARFCAQTPGFESGLTDVARLPKPKQPGYKSPEVLSKAQEVALVSACSSTRDRLIIETFLATGVRVSELCALTADDLVVGRTPYAHVHGSIHNRDRTKSGDDRKVPFRATYRTLPRRLEAFLNDRGNDHGHRELFLTVRGDPFTVWGIEQLTQRLEARSGIHCAPHKLRHTWATRCVDAGIQPFHLQQAGGWRSIEMVRRYYTADARETLEAFARAIEA
jgi:site-specific recombinase XerD